MSEQTLQYADEIATLTRGQWDFLLNLAKNGRRGVQAFLVAEQFKSSMHTIQSMTGHSQEQLEDVSDSMRLLACEQEGQAE